MANNNNLRTTLDLVSKINEKEVKLREESERVETTFNNMHKSILTVNNDLKDYLKLCNTANQIKLHTNNVAKQTAIKQTAVKNTASVDKGSKSSKNNKTSSDVDKVLKDFKKETGNVLKNNNDMLFNALNGLGSNYGRIINNTIKRMNTIGNIGKGLSSASKSMAKYNAVVGKTAKGTTGLTKAVSGLGSKAIIASGYLAALVGVLGLLTESGKYAYERNIDLNRALMQMGASNSELTNQTMTAENKLIHLKNTWINITDDLFSACQPLFTYLVGVVDSLSSVLQDVTQLLNINNNKTSASYGDSRVRGYTQDLKKFSGVPESVSMPVIHGIASSSKQSGFSNESSANLAINTYNEAMKLAIKYGEESQDVANKLADAWLNGSDAAKNYGVVVDDQVLAGYMASQGVDIVNVKITDAMKQYYRFQLMMEETSSDNSDYMQNQITEWKKLGYMIDQTKNKLFSFDEVIQLSAADSSIPEVGLGSLSYPSADGSEDNNLLPGKVPGAGDDSGSSSSLKQPVKSPVTDNVKVEIEVAGLDLLKDLQSVLEWLPETVILGVGVGVWGLAELKSLQEQLDILNNTSVEGNAEVVTEGVPVLNQALGLLQSIVSRVWNASVNIGVPAVESLLPNTLGYLEQISVDWSSSIDISVVGLGALEKAQALLAQVSSLMSQLGADMRTSAVKVGTGIKTASSSLKSGFTGNTKVSSLLSSYSPQSVSAYGGGLSGALEADKDLWKVRLGLADSTKEGYTASDLNKSTAEYVGYNLNPLNKNSLMNIEAKVGLTALGGKLGSQALSAGSNAISSISKTGSLAASFGFASGGIGTKEINNATLFEGNKKEAVIPLETAAGKSYLAGAMQEAGFGANSGNTGNITVNVNLSGLNIADNNEQWNTVGEKLAEVIDIQLSKRGALSYGSN